MAGFDWKAIVSTVAPTVATMLGGPLAGIAVKALSAKLLGRDDGTETEVAAAVQALGPQDLIRLREIEADLVKTLADNEIKLESLATQDRDSARRRATEARDWTPSILTFALLAVFTYVLSELIRGVEIKGSSEVLFTMFGTLSTALIQSLNFQFGTSRCSVEKSKVIANMKGAA
jgi:hypothetical protein